MEKSNKKVSSTEVEALIKELQKERIARKKAEQELEKKEQELDRSSKELSDLNHSLEMNIARRTLTLLSLIRNLGSGILLEDENNTLILANEKFCEMFDITQDPNELIGMDSGLIADEHKDQFKEPHHFLEIIRNKTKERQLSIGNKLELSNGKFFELDFIPVSTGQDFLGNLWKFRDITERSLYEQMIRNSEEKYRGILENMELGLMEVDIHGKIIKVYDRFCDMTGYEPQELLGEEAMKIFECQDYQYIFDIEPPNRKAGKSSVFETRLKKKSGQHIWVLISGAPFYDNQQNWIGSVGIHYDISSRKALENDLIEAREQADQAREAEKQFLANMSHEIRNPINSVVGLLNLLYDTKLSPEQFEYVNSIKYSAEVLMGLISDILDLSKIEAGKIELNEKKIDITEIIKAVVQTYSFKSVDKEISFYFDVDDQIDFPFLADPTIINQILLNLLGNAVKFTEKGKIDIKVRLLDDFGGSCRLQFAISDTGIGIPEDQLAMIFDSFRQANKETKLRYGGTGLGLSIVKHLVAMYLGSIEVSSEVGSGSTFTFDLTLKKFDLKNDSVLEDITLTNNDYKLEYVLVVEDNKLNQQYLTWLLEKWKIGYDIANHGGEALALIEKNKYDLILMDIRMPVMDGYETTIRIRNSVHNQNSRVPIIALTASALVDEKEKALNVGMNYHLSKPFSPEQLKFLLDSLGSEINDEEPKNSFHFSSELDNEYLKTFYGDDIDRAGLMFDIFLKNIDKELDELQKHFLGRNSSAFNALAHRIKPNFAMVGLPEFTDLMKELELLGKKEDYQQLNEIVPRFFKEFNKKKNIIVDELANINQHLDK